MEECDGDLREVDKVLRHFRSLDTKNPRFRDQLAFTTGKQTALRERIKTHSERIQQFLAGINIATLSRIERNTEVQLISLLEIEARLDQMHRDLLSGKRDASILEGASASTALEKEIMRDDASEADVDVSHVVSKWLDQVRHEQDTKIMDRPDIIPMATEAWGSQSLDDDMLDLPQPPKTYDIWANPYPVNSIKHTSPSSSPPIMTGHKNDVPHTPSDLECQTIDVRTLKQRTIATPHRQSGYDSVSKKCKTLALYSTTLDPHVNAIVVPVMVSQHELRDGTSKRFKIRRNVFKKDTLLHEETSFVTVRIQGQSKRTSRSVLYRHMGNRMVRDSRIMSGSEVIVKADHVAFRFYCD